MDWDNLLSEKRYSTEGATPPTTRHQTISVFQEDAERILYSSPFRRLQGKTQVHPFPIFDYLRTRLTHSIEVAHVGRALATAVATKLVELKDNINPQVAGDVVHAACLAHDLGNPPFGHIGEYAIQTWFGESKMPAVKQIMSEPDNAGDFLHFDGNAQGFRILTRLAGWKQKGGLQLSYATLSTFTKYPFSSKSDMSKKKKKIGYFGDDADAAFTVFSNTGLGPKDSYCRHPLAFLVEAADDICYLTTDIEDAFRMRLLRFETAESLLKDIAEAGNHMPRYSQIPDDQRQDRIAYLRSSAVATLIDASIRSFVDQRLSLMKGTVNEPLLETSEHKSHVQNIRRACQTRVYNDEKKLQIEAAGYKIISDLLDAFGGMIDQFVSGGEEKLNPRNAGLYHLLPAEYQIRLRYKDPYRSFIVLTDYISGMTDRFILDLHHKLTGSSVTLGRMT